MRWQIVPCPQLSQLLRKVLPDAICKVQVVLQAWAPETLRVLPELVLYPSAGQPS